MARPMLGSAIGKAATAAAEEMSLLIGVQKEIWFMKDELKTMQAFLIAAETMKKKDLLLKVWAEQVRSLSYDIEDCLDEFMVHVRSQRLSRQLMKLKDRHRIAVQIRNLKSRIEEVSNRNTRYTLIKIEDTNIDEADSRQEDVRLSAGKINEAELVGFATSKQKLLDMINAHDYDAQARVICVVGMGGLGKTTLVRKIYESKEDIAKNFSCCAWIIVSQSFSRIEMLKGMIGMFFGEEALKRHMEKLQGKELQVHDLADYLRNGLEEKRYLVVLDDLWNIDDWEWISSICLPRSNNKSSQIIVTTRNVGLAEKLTKTTFIYHLEPLKEEHALDLLLFKTGKIKEDMEKDQKLMTTVKKLVKKCGYLPLAILTIGAMFATKHVSEWENLYILLPSELETNLSLEAIRRMVMLSYNHLPSRLKPCFLYLSVFPEDFEIKRNHLVERWIAEGFIEARVGMAIENVGVSYFNELISRSMIIPSRVNIEGVVKRCRVHDIMRDIMVSICREENFVYTTGDNLPSAAEKNFRHVAFHGSDGTTLGMEWSRVRSLTFFIDRPMELATSLCSPKMRMLRVLDLRNAEFNIAQKEVNDIGLFHHLNYLRIGQRFKHSNVYALPRSIGKLQGLQTLDIGYSCISTIPTWISKLKNLRSLRCNNNYPLLQPMDCLVKTLCLPILFIPSVDSEYRSRTIAQLYMTYSSPWSSGRGVSLPRGIGSLKELRVLEGVGIDRTSRKAVEELGDLIRLQKLTVRTWGATERKCMILCKAIQKLSSLRSLNITATNDGTVEWLDSVSSLPSLRSLNLCGIIGDKVDWFRNLRQLVKIRLWASRLQEGKAMDILGALPNLRLLDLGFDTHVGQQLVFRQGTFLNLRSIRIWNLKKLRAIEFEPGALAQMEIIIIGICRLEAGINGIKHIPNLKMISLSYESQVARLGMLQEEVNAHPNKSKPVLVLENDRSYHDLGDTNQVSEAMESLPGRSEEGSQAIVPTPSDRSVLRRSATLSFLQIQKQ
ncbi:hypothetical protein EJB05_02442, partial [Eragrostis curvula]